MRNKGRIRTIKVELKRRRDERFDTWRRRVSVRRAQRDQDAPGTPEPLPLVVRVPATDGQGLQGCKRATVPDGQMARFMEGQIARLLDWPDVLEGQMTSLPDGQIARGLWCKSDEATLGLHCFTSTAKLMCSNIRSRHASCNDR